MLTFQPASDFCATQVRESSSKQGFMKALEAPLLTVEPGAVEIELPYHQSLMQQHQFTHAGASSGFVYTAGRFAASSFFEAGDGVHRIEFKINLSALIDGDTLLPAVWL